MKNTIKNLYMKSCVAAGFAMSPVFGLLAQESSGPQNTSFDTTNAIDAAKTIEKGLSDLVTALVPYIISVILAVIGAVVIYKIARWLLRAFNTRG